MGSPYSRVTRRPLLPDMSSFWDLKVCPGGISKLSGILLKPETCSHRICVAFLWVVHKLVRLRPRSPTHFYSLCIGSEKGEWWRRAFGLHGLIVELSSCFVFIFLLLLFYRDKQHCTECHINIYLFLQQTKVCNIQNPGKSIHMVHLRHVFWNAAICTTNLAKYDRPHRSSEC